MTSACPFRLRRAGLRSVYEPAAVAEEPVAATTADEWTRKVRMLSRAWGDVLRGGMLDPRRPAARLLRRAGLAPAAALRHGPAPRRPARVQRWRSRRRRPAARALLARHAAWLAPPSRSAGRRGVPVAGLAWYYLVVTAASVAGLDGCSRDGSAGDVGAGGGHAVMRRAPTSALKRAVTWPSATPRGRHAPVLAAIAIAIRLESRGPVVLRQTRVGMDGKRLRAVQVPHDGPGRPPAGRRLADRRETTRASRASGASCASGRWTSSRSSGTCCAAT